MYPKGVLQCAVGAEQIWCKVEHVTVAGAAVGRRERRQCWMVVARCVVV
jgi:hypothetical protein